jgi:hypothetical protein
VVARERRWVLGLGLGLAVEVVLVVQYAYHLCELVLKWKNRA